MTSRRSCRNSAAGWVALRETREVLARMEAGRLRPATSYKLSCAIVSALTRHQEAYVESVTSEVWQLEQQVTGGEIDDPEEFLNELFRTRHGLLAVRTMGVLSGAIYGRMTNLVRVSPGVALNATAADSYGAFHGRAGSIDALSGGQTWGSNEGHRHPYGL